ncbi:DMT family transporter [Geochorda subterranea]|uniref:DMT family transporter n=1 Tax=Geochorda subterranea TaxID=3109564 RepID=A0ABZ1BM48_9FIRM|nr:DMT family transporter [Limnochorda sp. LNt]WRP13884.1 DMT family transporter [Limnochorda sp. LNt]
MSDPRTGRRALGAYLMLTAAPLLWAGNWVIGRVLVAGVVTSLEITVARWLVGAAVLLGLVARREGGLPRLDGRQWLSVVAGAALGMVAYTLLQYEALRHTQAINGTLIFSASPAFTLVLAATILGERWGLSQVAGIALALAGVGVILLGGSGMTAAGLRVQPGDALMVAASWTWAAYTVLARVAARRLSSLAWTAWAMAVAGVGLLPWQLVEWWRGAGGLPALLAEGLSPRLLAVAGALLYIGLFASAAAYVFWGEGVRRVGASVGSVFGNLLPVFTALLAVATLGERLHLAHLLGAAGVMGGVWLTTRPASGPGPAAAPRPVGRPR